MILLSAIDIISTLSDALADALESNEQTKAIRKNYNKKFLQKLESNYYSVDESLDLHRLNIMEAKESLVELYCDSLNKENRCLHIIFGKSIYAEDRRTTLKSLVINWLRQLNQVVAYCSAPPSQGGEGAVIVLLDSETVQPQPGYDDWKSS